MNRVILYIPVNRRVVSSCLVPLETVHLDNNFKYSFLNFQLVLLAKSSQNMLQYLV